MQLKLTLNNMKKLWAFRFYGLVIIGVALLFIGMFNPLSTIGIICWAFGIIISFTGVLLQIIIAPNFGPYKINVKVSSKEGRLKIEITKEKYLICPDCNAKLKLSRNKLEFIEHLS